MGDREDGKILHRDVPAIGAIDHGGDAIIETEAARSRQHAMIGVSVDQADVGFRAIALCPGILADDEVAKQASRGQSRGLVAQLFDGGKAFPSP